MTQEAIQDRLGACPIEELREAWSDMEAVERAAVEQEVIRLCTERAVLIGEFLGAHRDLRAALGPLVPELPAPVAVPGAVSAAETRGVEKPGAGSAGLEPDLAATGDNLPGVADAVDAAPPSDPPGAGGEPLGQLADVLGIEGGAVAPGRPGDGDGDPSLQDLPPPGAASPENVAGGIAALDGTAAPAGPSWVVLFTAKRSDGDWLAMIRETDPPPLVLPALATEEGDGVVALPPVLAPRPPEAALFSEGEQLAEGGPVVVRIDGSGVEIAPAVDGDAVSLPWAPAGVLPWSPVGPALEPGRADFVAVKEGE